MKRCHPQLVPPKKYVENQPKESPWAIITAFSEELAEINRLLAQQGASDFVARLYLRSLFSMLDGYAWYVKHRALEGAKRVGIHLTVEDIETIFEVRRKKFRDGTERVLPKIVPTRENLVYALRLYGRVRSSEPAVGLSLPPDFDVASEARNRITHPKRTLDFKVFPNERVAVGELLIWLQTVMEWVKTEELKNIEEIRQEINASTEQLRQKILASVEPGAE